MLFRSGMNSQAAISSFIKSYFKIVKECTSMTDCFAPEYKTMKGNVYSSYTKNIPSFVLANGASIRPSYSKAGNKISNVGIDINGQQGPNILGRDLVFFAVYNNGLIDDYIEGLEPPLSKDDRDDVFTAQCNGGAPDSGWGCFGKILNDNWEMTY